MPMVPPASSGGDARSQLPSANLDAAAEAAAGAVTTAKAHTSAFSFNLKVSVICHSIELHVCELVLRLKPASSVGSQHAAQRRSRSPKPPKSPHSSRAFGCTGAASTSATATVRR